MNQYAEQVGSGRVADTHDQLTLCVTGSIVQFSSVHGAVNKA